MYSSCCLSCSLCLQEQRKRINLSAFQRSDQTAIHEQRFAESDGPSHAALELSRLAWHLAPSSAPPNDDVFLCDDVVGGALDGVQSVRVVQRWRSGGVRLRCDLCETATPLTPQTLQREATLFSTFSDDKS